MALFEIIYTDLNILKIYGSHSTGYNSLRPNKTKPKYISARAYAPVRRYILDRVDQPFLTLLAVEFVWQLDTSAYL